MKVTIALEQLAWLDRCQRRVWLDQHGQPQDQVELARDAVARIAASRSHTQQMIAGLPGLSTVAADSWETRVAATVALMSGGAPLIASGMIAASVGDIVLRATPHLLRRTPDLRARGGWSYQPIDIRLHGEPTRWDRVRVDVLRWLVAAALGDARVPEGELWLGVSGDAPARVVARRAAPIETGPTLAARYDAVVSGPEPPIWFDSDHCPFCPWRDACDGVALMRSDLALLPGLKRSHARVLRQAGTHTITELSEMPLARVARLPDSDMRVAQRLNTSARALLSGQAVPHQELPTAHVARTIWSDARGRASTRTEQMRSAASDANLLFMDIETDPVTRLPWAIGWMTLGGDVTIALVGPASVRRRMHVAGARVVLVRSVAHAWQLAARAGRGPVLHWGDAESLLLARTAEQRARAALAPQLRDLHALITERVALPIERLSTRRSAGLKAVAGWLGYHWAGGAEHWTDGWDAYRAWRIARRSRPAIAAPAAPAALAPAIAYLSSDLAALARVWAWYVETIGVN